MTREEKQKAIDVLKISAPLMAMTQEEFDDYIKIINQVIDWLEQEPTIGQLFSCEEVEELRNKIWKQVEQEPKWIPVSERLPESAGVYIVTREFTDGFEYADLADACYFDGTSTWHDDNRINHGREYADKKIKAWMPLPEPYEPQEKGSE